MTLRAASTALGFVLLSLPPALAGDDKRAAIVTGEAHFSTGLDQLRAGRYDLAVEAFQAAIKEDPKNPYFYKGLGDAYLAQRKFSDAITALRKAIEINPYYVDVRSDLGTALLLGGKRDEGKKELEAAFSNPENPTPEVTARNLSQAYLEEKKYEQALNWSQTSLSKNKAYPDAYLLTSDILTTLGRSDDAIALLESGVKELPKDMTLALNLGLQYYRAARFVEARQRLEQVAAKDPGGAAGRRAADLLAKFPKQ